MCPLHTHVCSEDVAWYRSEKTGTAAGGLGGADLSCEASSKLGCAILASYTRNSDGVGHSELG